MLNQGFDDDACRMDIRSLASEPTRPCAVCSVTRMCCVACRHCGIREARTAGLSVDNPRFTKRVAFDVDRRCRQASTRDVAKELKLDWGTVKTLEMQYIRA